MSIGRSAQATSPRGVAVIFLGCLTFGVLVMAGILGAVGLIVAVVGAVCAL